MSENKVDIKGWPIHFETVGSGPEPLLLIPGSIGTAETDFYDQLYGDSVLDVDRFTMVCIELPGWGRSRPPVRMNSSETLENDADCCVQLMQALGYNKFSVLGWSEGARVALIMASIYQKSVKNLILMGLLFQPTVKSLRGIINTNDVSKWHRDVLDNYLLCYKDVHEVRRLWSRYISFLIQNPIYYPKGLCNLEDIKCPTLVLHGDKDPIISLDQSLMTLNGIEGAKIIRFGYAGHDMHKKCKDQFKLFVEEFLP